jgi:hypothetical protein
VINILYQSPWNLGGSTSYVVHLAKVLRMHYVDPSNVNVVRIGKRTEHFRREMGSYGVHYQILSFDDLMSLPGALLYAAADPDMKEEHSKALAKRRKTWATFHDPNEFGLYPHWEYWNPRRVICVRETGLAHYRRGVFIPHPYLRKFSNAPESKPYLGLSIARTSSIKNSHWIIEANRELRDEVGTIALRGALNRVWWRGAQQKYGKDVDIKQLGYPRTFGAEADLCRGHKFMVDLTVFKQDGGGTQYTLLAAMDAGAVPVMSRDWCSYTGPARTFGPSVDGVPQLVHLLRQWRKVQLNQLRGRNYRYLDSVHAPARIGRLYIEALT